MRYKLEYISTFHADVLNVINILSDYPKKAERIFSKLDKILGKLAYMPEMYPVYEGLPIFRKITVEDYLVFYTIKKPDRLIEVHRLIFERMDVSRRLM